MLARLVPPSSRVIEFGAGRRQLERYLGPDCSYIPSDLTDRGPGTIICDLNRRPLPDLVNIAPTVAVFGGVLEYVRDVRSLVNWLSLSGIQSCIVSYESMPAGFKLGRRLVELQRRLYYGYMNNLTERELKRAFKAAGMTCAEEHRWTSQGIYRFVKDDRSAGPNRQ
jgi:hypothetical protein